MLNCTEVTRLYSESLEHPLTLRQRMAVQSHAMMCSGCRNFGKQMHQLRSLSQQYVDRKDPPADA